MTAAGNAFLDDDDVVEQPDESDGSRLRKWGKAEKKRADEAEARLKELEAKLARMDADAVFAKLGVPEKVRKFYSGDPTEDAVAAWVKENADVFGLETIEPTQTPEQQETQAAAAQVQQATQIGQDKPQAFTREALNEHRQALLSQKHSSLADLEATLSKMGVPNLPQMAPQF